MQGLLIGSLLIVLAVSVFALRRLIRGEIAKLETLTSKAAMVRESSPVGAAAIER